MRRCAALTVCTTSIIFTFPSYGGRCWCHTTRKPYQSLAAFKLHPDEVNETNVPSAREVASMIPSRAELKQQLPSARELEVQYVCQEVKTVKPVTAQEGPLWPDSDTIEDIMDEERYGSAEGKDEVPPPAPHHFLLAWRALLWGTLYALLGVTLVVWTAMYICGMHSVADVMAHQRGYADRERCRLEAEGREVSYFVLDLTSPSTLFRQVEEIWQALEKLAEDKKEGEDVSR